MVVAPLSSRKSTCRFVAPHTPYSVITTEFCAIIARKIIYGSQQKPGRAEYELRVGATRLIAAVT